MARQDDTERDLKVLVTCTECDDILYAPRMLACTHVFCEACVLKLRLHKVHEQMGYHCPSCGTFTNKDDVKENVLIRDLVALYHNVIKTDLDLRNVCGNCLENEPKWKCLDCRLDVCRNCKDSHDHDGGSVQQKHVRFSDVGSTKSVLTLHSPQPREISVASTVVDKALFCGTHYNQLLSWNCMTCERPVCDECKSARSPHRNHAIEPIDNALARLVPTVKAFNVIISDRVKAGQFIIKELQKKMSEISAAVDRERAKLDNTYQAYLAKFKADYDELMSQMDALEKDKKVECEKLIESIQLKDTRKEQLVQWTNTTLSVAKNASLLHELQAGLMSKVTSMAREKTDLPFADDFDDTRLEFVPFQGQINIDSIENVVGKVFVYGIAKDPYVEGEASETTSLCSSDVDSVQGLPSRPNIIFPMKSNSLEWNFPISLLPKSEGRIYCQFTLEQNHTAHRFAMLWGDVWVPVDNQSQSSITVYSNDGKLLRDIKLHASVTSPRALVQCANDEVAIACNKGVYVLNRKTGKLSEHLTGNFSDICMYQSKLYALDNTRGRVTVLAFKSLSWLTERHIQLERTERGITDTLVVDKHHLYIASWSNYCVFKFNHQGTLRAKYGNYGCEQAGQVDNPTLCGFDSSGALVLCDKWNHRLQVLSREKQWSTVTLPGLEKPSYAAPDCRQRALWVLCDARRLCMYTLH